jgi:hypothetical protein
MSSSPAECHPAALPARMRQVRASSRDEETRDPPVLRLLADTTHDAPPLVILAPCICLLACLRLASTLARVLLARLLLPCSARWRCVFGYTPQVMAMVKSGTIPPDVMTVMLSLSQSPSLLLPLPTVTHCADTHTHTHTHTHLICTKGCSVRLTACDSQEPSQAAWRCSFAPFDICSLAPLDLFARTPLDLSPILPPPPPP